MHAETVCPLRLIASTLKEGIEAKCTQEQCSWWDTWKKQCSIKGIAYEISEIT